MKKILLFLLLLMTTGQLKTFAQLTGDTIVCSGFIYSYNASIPGAVSYAWTTPAGWYDLTGQGTPSISVTCNVTNGNVCVEGFDVNANSLGTLCLSTSFGGGAVGWDLLPNPVSGCLDPPFSFTPYIQMNGTGGGGCPPGCGNGTLHPNLVYGLYNSVWPSGTLISIIDGVTPVSSWGLGPGTLYAYFVDITNGMNPPNAVLISGGCGSATINNTTNISYIDPIWPILGGGGGSCIGDTIIVSEGTGAAFNFWDFEWGCTLISGQFSYPAYVVIDSAYCELYFDGTDVNGCHTYGVWQQYFQPCVPAVAGFASADTFLCPGTCTDFSDQALNATSLQWLFPGGVPPSSNANNPQNICYGTPGSYDVTQIAYSPYGNDTLTLTNYISVYPFPPPQSIFQSGDTLFSDPVFASYQWYYNGNLLAGATNYYYVATQSGDYNVVCADSNGCEVEAAIFNVLASVQFEVSGLRFEVFPNPADEFIVVSSEFGVAAKEISVYNILGEMVLAVPRLSKGEGLGGEADVSQLPSGIYFLEINTMNEKKIFRKKFIKR